MKRKPEKKHRRKGRRTGRVVLRIILYAVLCLLLVLIAFAVVYRYQIVDTFRPELRRYNPFELLGPSTKPTILIQGDSFTAGRNSYPAIMRPRCPSYRVINAGISGTGVIEANLVAPRRLERFKPSIFVYQVYVGNDLFNIRYPINWRRLSVVRNLNWTVAQHVRSIGHLNYRVGQFLAAMQGRHQRFDTSPTTVADPLTGPMEPVDQTQFSPAHYAPLEKLYLKAEPYFLENQIMVRRDRRDDFDLFLKTLHGLLMQCDRDVCKVYVLLIPHCCQVQRRYLENMKALGAKFSDPDEILASEYPFMTRTRQYLDSQSMSDVDILNPLGLLKEKEAEGQSVYYQDDSHLNAAGQRVIAEFLLDKLELGSGGSDQ